MAVKKVLISLGHPAHFHLFKNINANLNNLGIETEFLIREKDVLENLLKNEDLAYYNILPKEKGSGFLALTWSILLRDIRLFKFCLRSKPDLIVGSTVEITHVGKLVNIPAISVGEDDMDVVPLFSRLAAPFSDCLVFPSICRMGKWTKKTLTYNSYQELAYLHPNHFRPDKKIVRKYFNPDYPYFILRLSALSAHHDKGIKGLDEETTNKIISFLAPHGAIYLTSEKKLQPEFERYRISINPIDIHHVLAYSQLLICDSQTMAAEAGVLGTPFIRMNDFVGKISYLNELEDIYQLGYGIAPSDKTRLFDVLSSVLLMKERKKIFEERRWRMLAEKIDTSKFLTWLIINYPESKIQIKQKPELSFQFK